MQVFVNVVHVGVGPISQHDIDLAQACGAYIVGFNIRTPPIAITQAAARANIKVPFMNHYFSNASHDSVSISLMPTLGFSTSLDECSVLEMFGSVLRCYNLDYACTPFLLLW